MSQYQFLYPIEQLILTAGIPSVTDMIHINNRAFLSICHSCCLRPLLFPARIAVHFQTVYFTLFPYQSFYSVVSSFRSHNSIQPANNKENTPASAYFRIWFIHGNNLKMKSGRFAARCAAKAA